VQRVLTFIKRRKRERNALAVRWQGTVPEKIIVMTNRCEWNYHNKRVQGLAANGEKADRRVET
jgi:hypothetical protein